MNKRPNRPGKTVSRSGQYDLINQAGRLVGREVTLVKGEPFPPTPSRGQSFRLSDKTKHKR